MKLIRDGKRVWPTCSKCGCRLQIKADGPKYMLSHFIGESTKVSYNEVVWHTDARGCKCPALIDFWMIEKKQLAHIGM